MRSYRATELSTIPPTKPMASYDREPIGFDAGQAITAAAAVLRNLDTGVQTGPRLSGAGGTTAPLESVSIVGNVATAMVSGLTRENTYLLAMTFSTATGRKFTKTVLIPVLE